VQVPFDAVEAVEVHEGPAGYQLRVRYRRSPEQEPEEALLVAGAGAGEVEALRRLWRTLHHAFGLRGPPLAGA
jgi:hypothetical protein